MSSRLMRIRGAARAQRLVWDIKEWRTLRRLAGPKLIRAFSKAYPDAFFIEIGANDGDHHDHLRPYILSRSWRGIMVEPVPYLFDRLRANYQEIDRVALENAAIADRDGTLPFFYVVDADPADRKRLPDWYDGIGSFDRDNIVSHRWAIPDIEDRIVQSEVKCMTFEALCARHGVDRLDILAVDTEGYDAEILRMIDFHVWRPRLVVYEHFHLSGADRRETRDRLRSAGYELLEERFDTFGLLPHQDDALDRYWRGLEPAMPALLAEDVIEPDAGQAVRS